jgi:hypothetical protein
MQKIFSDFKILKLIKDHEAFGVFLKARKPENYTQVDLSDINLYSMILGKRTKDIPSFSDMSLSRKLMLRFLSMKLKYVLPRALLHVLEYHCLS